MRYAFVLNPAAQHGRAGRRRASFEAALRAEGVAYSVVETTGPRHATRLAREATREADVVVAVGGDGTIHEVARGVHGTGAVMGVLPLGTGNDFAHAVGMPDDLQAAVRALLTAKPQPVDLGRVRWQEAAGGRAPDEHEALFTNCVGIGFDALAAQEAGRFKVLGSGRVAYLAGVLRALWGWRQPEVEVALSMEGAANGGAAPAVRRPPSSSLEGDRLHDGRFFLLEVGNGFSIGGGFLMTPDAVVDDGLLDVCLIDRISRPRVLRLLPTTFTGRHVHQPEVTMRRTRRVTVRSAVALPFHVDGEALGGGAYRLDAEVLPGALQLLAPQVRRT